MKFKSVVFLSLILFTSGCSFFGFSRHTVSGLICRENFEIGQQCTVFDPILKQQVSIDPNNGVMTTCNIDKNNLNYYLCFYTYSDSMGNTWNGRIFRETRKQE